MTALERLRALCAIDSPTGDHAGLGRCADLLLRWAHEDGLETERRETPEGPIVVARTEGRGHGRTLLLGHHDTVYPPGTAGERPVIADGDRLLGPGVADMKGGLIIALAVLAELAADPEGSHGTVELWSLPDEESRSTPPSSLDAFRGADAALVFECGYADGSIVTRRKAGAWIEIEATGREAHAGYDRARGRSALAALLPELERIAALDGDPPNLQVTVTRVAAGSGRNTVPGRASATIDLRADTRAGIETAIDAIACFGTYDGITFIAGDEPGFPPQDRDPALATLALEALAAAGAPALETTAFGASDACWTSFLGIPTVDGLGPIGGGDHSPAEWIAPDSIAPRIAAVVTMCRALGEGCVKGVRPF
jgi:glutamate carboxypeptidase